MKILTILCIIILLFSLPVILVAGCQKQTTPASSPSPDSLPTVKPALETKTYANSEHGFSVEYPADWDKNDSFTEKEKLMGLLVIFEGPKSTKYDRRASIVIEADECPSDYTVEEYAKAVELQILKKNFKDYSNLQEQQTTIGGIPALMKTFTATINNFPYKDIQAYFIKGNLAYAITYEVTTDSYDKYIDCFDLVKSTFKFD